MNWSIRIKQVIALCLLVLFLQKTGVNAWARQYFSAHICKETTICIRDIDSKGKIHHNQILSSSNKAFETTRCSWLLPAVVYSLPAAPSAGRAEFSLYKLVSPAIFFADKTYRRGPPSLFC